MDSPVIFTPVETPTTASPASAAPTTEDEFRTWIGHLSLLDQGLLRQHADDEVLPDKVAELLRFSPVKCDEWSIAGSARSFYPESLRRALEPVAV